ncbi:MAG: hypothetical protein ACE5F8_06700, partial [Woeseiaceae bacterium]
MNTNLRKAQCAFFGIVVTLICGVPALADDTEILLINPNAANPPQPNVMFIFDSSGSMRGRVTTQLPYDSSNTYPPDAGCDPDMLYWTEVSTVPDCNTTIQFFEKTAGVCDAAAARMTGLGSYSDNMVHYRSDGAGSSAWQTLEPGNANGLVEGQSDSGVHGLGAASPADVFAQKGSTLTPYTADPNQEIDWTTASVTQGVTVYDGNFL